jgi:proteic killer suppression protein
MSPKTVVFIDRFAEKQIRRLPHFIKECLQEWVEAVEHLGLIETRKRAGYHDEPLKGGRKGQRSVRLNRSYRVIYIETIKSIEIIVIEVSKHGY